MGRVLGGLITAVVMLASTPAAQAAEDVKSLSFDIRVDPGAIRAPVASGRDLATSTFTLELPLPASAATVDQLLSSRPGADQQQAVQDALVDTQLLGPGTAASLAGVLDGPVVTEVFSQSARVRGRFNGDAPWELGSSGGCQIMLPADLWDGTNEVAVVPKGSALSASVTVVDGRPQTATPRPSSLIRDSAEWRFAADDELVRLCAVSEPALPTGPGENPSVLVRIGNVGSTLLLAIPTTTLLLVGVWWALRPDRRPPRRRRSGALTQAVPADVAASRRARRLAMVVLALPLAVVAARVVQSAWLTLAIGDGFLEWRLTGAVATAVAAAVVVLGVAFCARRIRPRPGPWRRVLGWLVTAAAIFVTALLPLSAVAEHVPPARFQRTDDAIYNDFLAADATRLVLLVGAVLVAVAVATLLVVTVWRAFVGAVPAPWRDRLVAGEGRTWRQAGAFAFVFVVIGLSVWAQVDQIVDHYRAAAPSDGLMGVIRDGVYFDDLARRPSQVILTLAQAATYVLPLVVVVAVGTALLLGVRAPNAVPTSLLNSTAVRAVAVTFAAGVVVTGTHSVNVLPAEIGARARGSTIESFLVPVTLFVIAVCAVLLVEKLGRGAASAAEAARTKAQRTQLLRHTAVTELSRRRLHRRYTEFLEGKLEADEYFGSAPPPQTRGDAGLELGPLMDWRANAAEALRLGAVLAILPVAYTLWIVLSRVPRTLSPYAGIAPAYAIGDVLSEILFWLIAAFAFGALFAYLPRRTGLFKGLSLGVLVLVPHALVALLLPGREAPAFWLFTVAEVTLFGMALGLLMDLATLRGHGIYWRHLLDIYRVRTLRAAFAYGVPVVLATVTIVDHLVSGRAGDAAAELVKTASGFR